MGAGCFGSSATAIATTRSSSRVVTKTLTRALVTTASPTSTLPPLLRNHPSNSVARRPRTWDVSVTSGLKSSIKRPARSRALAS